MDTSLFETVFHSRLKDGFPALFCCENASAFTNRLLQIEEREGAYYTARNTLSSIFIPREYLHELLELHCIPDRRMRLDINSKRRDAFDANIAYHPWVEVLPRCLLSSMSRGELYVSGQDLQLEQDLLLRPEDVRGTLSELLGLIEQHEHMHVVWLETDGFPVFIHQKSGVGALFALPARREGTAAAAYSGQPDGLAQLEDWFTSHSYDRDASIRAIRDAMRAIG